MTNLPQRSLFKFVALACAVAASSASWGADAPTADSVRRLMPQIDEFMKAEVAREKVPGVALGIVVGGTVVASKGYGYANVEDSAPVTGDTIFESGSIGKAFTAMAVMTQVDDGKISLDDPLTKYFPDAPKWWSTINIRQMLNHTSGIADYAEDDANAVVDGKPPYDWQRNYSDEELTKIAYRIQMDFPAGTKWHYCNTSYLLLGVMLDKVTGHFYGDLLMDRVFKPLGMKTARMISEADIVKNRSAGYRLVNGELKNQEWVSPTFNSTADGSLYLSVNDYIAWDRGLRAQAILKPESWKEVYTPAALKDGQSHPYGLGWHVDSWHGKPLYHHSGSWQGFRTSIARYLADDMTIVVLTNLADASPEAFIDGAAQLIDPELPKMKHKKKG